MWNNLAHVPGDFLEAARLVLGCGFALAAGGFLALAIIVSRRKP